MKKGKVICKFILVILLLLSMLPIFVTNTAVAVDLEGQDNTTQSDKVKFKAYFTSSTGTETHSMVADINGQRPEINYQINVEEGRLENPVIKVTDENGTLDNNFMMPIKLSGTSQVIDRIDAENKTIYFRQITDGYITGSFPLSIDATADFDLKKMNQNSKITLTGTYYGDDGSVVSINKSIYVNLGWEANFNIHVAQRISKYIPYNRNGERGITIQIAVRTRLDTATKPYPLPVKKTTVTMQIPTFNGINPTQYAVAAVSTAATNGRDGTVGNEVIFSNANCSADLENHTITIQVENTPENNVVASSLGTDEYLITFDYPASAYDSIMETGNAFLCKTTSTMEVYSNTSTKTFTNTAEDNYTLKEIVGADSEGALEKAIFYRNSIKQESGVEQGYNFNVSLEIQELGTINSLRIEEHDQEFVDAEGNRYSTNVDGVNYIYTTMFAMSKQNFEMIFGTEGYVQVYDKKGTLLGTINKNSPLDENGFYYINLPEKTGPVVSITSKPIVISGTYTYIAHRDISPDMPYTKAEISTFQNLAEGFTNTSRKDGESDYTGGGSAEAMLPLVEPLSQSTISISKQSLEVGKVNENVILTITVKNGAPAKFEWYARPIFDIELPEYITDVEINASRMLYTNDLSIKNVEVIKRNGKNYLRVTVDGESTNLYTKDTTIEINTNLTVDPMTPTVAKDINMYYYNESSVHYYNEVPWALEGIPEDGVNGIDTIQVGFIADPELISVSEISNYESTGKVVSSLEETNNTGKIENNNQDTTANMTLKILNNTFAECTNPVILGRIPTQGNKAPVSGEDLGSTFTTLLAGNITAVAGIEPSQMTIYYSENADATKDIAEPSNGWTTTPSDLKTIKSYLIVTNDFTLPAGEMLQFTYPFTVPANQSYLSTSYGTFGVYYNQNNTAESGKVGLVIPEGEKYTFLLTKTDENSGTIIQNVTFNLNGRGLSVTKYKTNALGQIRIAGLYPNEIYTLSEEPLEGYQVEEGNQIQFKLISESGTWKLQVLKGSFNGEAQITPESSGQEIVASVSLTNTKIKYNITTEAGEGGTISGSEENPYEIVGYGENSTKDIVITPNPNYEIKTIYVNDEPTEIPTLGPDGTVTLDKFTNVTENIHVRVEFQKIVAGGVTVKYIDKATGEEILQQKTQSGYVGDNYSFTREEIASYEAEEPEPTNSTGYLTKDPIEVIFYYKKVEPDITGHSITKTGPEKITSDTDAISYTIQYQVNVNQYIGEATVTIVDTLPYALDEDKVNQLDGGNYDAGQKTITWVETIENFDTYQTEAKTITFTKNVTLYYKDMNYGAENVQNQVSGKLSLKTPTKEDTVKGQVTTPIEITTSVEAVKTWVDNENADGNRPEAIYLQVKNDQGLVQEQKVTGDDWRYTFTGLPKYNTDGSVITYTVDEREENPGDLKLYNKQISGNTITNTYKLSNTNIKEPAIDKTGTSTITSKDEQLEYTITYNATVENYIGTGTITIVDTLPYAIDESKPYDLAGGEYNKQAKTITWVESLGDIDTFQEGAKQVNISKTIQLSYENINVEEGRLVNNVSGKIDLDATKDSDTQTDTFETTQNFVTSVEAVKTWVDNENADGNRPESIYLQVKNGAEMVEEALVTGPDWKYTFTNLPKYEEDGNIITYTVDEREAETGDLKLYTKQIEGNTITNTYKLTNQSIQNPTIDKTGTAEITSKDQALTYTIAYTATVDNYIGTGRVTIVDTLPYELDESKPNNLQEGEYNKEAKTITWVEELGDIDTFSNEAEEINITKTITVYYQNINVEEGTLVNNVSGKIDLDTTKETDTKEDTFETTENFTTSVEAIKTWEDNENADGNRPTAIYLQVKNGEQVVQEQKVTGPDWKYTFNNLPKYSSDGNSITYTVDEREETPGDLTLYNKQISGNTITNTYKLSNTNIKEPTIDKTGTSTITSKDEQLEYTITYNATIENYIGTGRVTIVDTLPYAIDESKPYELDGGNYDKEAKTITWVEDLGDIDTFQGEAKEINISKTIQLSYENINVTEGSFSNKVSGKIELDTTKDTNTTEDTFETTENFVTSVEAVKTWVDNDNADGNRPKAIYLQVKNGNEVVQESLVTEKEGWKHTFTNLPKYGEDGNSITYTVDEREQTSGDLSLYDKQIKGNTITNTYKLTDTSIQDPSIQKMGTLEITSKDQALDYIISYTATVNNYIGTGRVTIVDTLPYELDESKPNNLDGGIYNKEAKTITWVEELGDIDTFQGEAKEINITKNIKVYYQNISVQEDKLVNKVSGKIDLDTTKETNTQEDTLETKQNFVTEVEVVKTWVDEENADGNRPDVIYLQVKNGDQVVQEQKVTGPDWKYTFTGLPKYSSEGSTITYTVDEREETPGDLALYNKQISGNTITNTYKLSSTNIKEPSIEKTGTTEITSKDEQVEYTITYHATVENYVGTGTVTIVDTLPYAIDETKPYDLAGGTYNKEAKTITWVENLGDIDTFQGEAKEINIRKTIQLSYENINVEEGSLNNKVSGTIYLDATKDTDTKEDTFETTENFVTEVEVVKTWEDEENADGNRPDAIYLQVKNGDEVVQESLVTEKEGWKHTFTGLPKYQADGSIITYTVDEREETAGDLELYDKQISGNTITNTYKLTDSSIKNPSIKKTGTTEITNQQQAITYTIHYTANIENYIGTGRVTIVDTLPYELDEAKPNDLAGGNYDKQTKTITWVEELGEMDTFAGQTKEINISKTITVYYQNISPAEGKIVNQVTGKVELDTTKETNTKQDTWETTKNFLTEVEVVKTWVDNENADGNRPESIYLQVKNGNEVVQESLVTEKEGWKHTFTGLPKYHADGSIINYTVDEREVNAGDLTLYDKQINGNIITNTYKLSETSIKNPTIEKTGTDVIANETESLTYKIAYNVTIENYLGNAQVTIVDTLPYELDETKENKLDGGTYDAKTKTITWTQTIENIDTYQKESMLVSITKNIEVYYKEIKEEDASFVNTAEATITLETTKETQTVTDKTETSKNFTTELQVSKIWEDNNNQDGNRPEAIYLQVKDGNTVVQEQKVDETNDWKYTFTGLPKYHTDGSIINYTIDEKEVKKGDLTFYQKSINGNVITNTYTLNKESIQNPKIEKEGPAEITEVTDAITYTITYQANVTNYQGSGTLTIVDTLPYPLDETKQNNLAGGTYDKETQTITWVEELSNINAIGDNVQTITWNKAIQVYYSITDDTVTSIRNTVKGTIFLENGEQTDTQEDTQTVVTKQDGSILVHYYLEGTTQKIAEDVVIVGKVGETYQTTEAKGIDSKYELVTVPDNKEGTIGENSQTVIYYYRIKTYEITTEAGEGGSITGSEEKPFEVVNHGEDSQKEIIIIPSTGYKVSNVYINDVPVDFTVREDGTVTLEQIKNVTENKKVVAVFEKIPAGGITIHYVDKETGEELLPTEQIEGGYVGETYVVKRKDIPYYNPVLPEPENSKGRLTEGNIDVTFYYQKQVFDITVDKWIQSVTVDGETKAENTYASKGEIVKRDVHAKKTNQTTIEVSYCIRVSNTGEIAGTVGKVIESIPGGMYWNPEENPGWVQDEVTGYIINDSLAEVTLNPGEYKELEFVLHWKQGEANIGEQINQVFIQDVNNEAQYPDSKPNNDTAQAELLIAISPGIFENNITYIVIAILVLSTAVVIIVHYRTKTKQR